MTWSGIWVVVVAVATACGSSEKKANDSSEQATLRKLDAYLQCHLDHSQIVFRTEDVYRLDFAEGPPGPGAVVVLTATPDPAKCVEDVAAAKVLQPAMPELEAAGAAYTAELVKVHRLTSTYDRAKAADLHGELMSAFDAFDRAQANLFDQVYAVNRKMHLAQFARRNAGDNLDSLLERTQLAAEDVVRFAAVPSNQLDKLDTVALAASIAALERPVEALRELARQDPDQVGTLEDFPKLLARADDLVTASRQLARRAHDNVPYTDAEKVMIREGNAVSVAGSPAALAHAYNRVEELH